MLAMAGILAPSVAYAGVREDAVAKVISNYMPGVTGFGKVTVKSVAVNDAKRTITRALSSR